MESTIGMENGTGRHAEEVLKKSIIPNDGYYPGTDKKS
jgi:hypothetical protein